MSPDTSPGKRGRGWPEFITANEKGLKSITAKVRSYRDQREEDFIGVEIKTSEEDVVVKFTPSPYELSTAPIAIKRVLNDIGVKPQDSVTLELSIPKTGSSFDFKIIPKEITEDRFGIAITSSPTDDRSRTISLVTHEAGDMEPSHHYAESIPLQWEALRGRAILGKASRIRVAYKAILNSVDKTDTRNYPYRTAIMRAAGKWAVNLLEARRKTSPQEVTLENWREKFPFPDALEMEEFHEWLAKLDEDTRTQILKELNQWSRTDITFRQLGKPPKGDSLPF